MRLRSDVTVQQQILDYVCANLIWRVRRQSGLRITVLWIATQIRDPFAKAGEGTHFCEGGSWGLSMPLERGRMIGYDPSRMTFEFMMMDKAKVVDCEISSSAIDQLAGTKGTMPADREAQFLRLRDAIERIASDLFDEGMPTRGGMIRIFHHNVRQRELR